MGGGPDGIAGLARSKRLPKLVSRRHRHDGGEVCARRAVLPTDAVGSAKPTSGLSKVARNPRAVAPARARPGRSEQAKALDGGPRQRQKELSVVKTAQNDRSGSGHRLLDRPLLVVTFRRVLISFGLALLLSTLLFLFRGPCLKRLSDVLVRDHDLKHTDAILILGGDLPHKVDHAARIYPVVRPEIILISPTVKAASDAARLLDVHSLPAERIEIIPVAEPPTSTYGEAVALRDFLKNSSIRSVTVVTNAFHTRRAFWTFRRLVSADIEIRMASSPEVGFSRHNWWKTESGVVTVNNELIKRLYYWWNY